MVTLLRMTVFSTSAFRQEIKIALFQSHHNIIKLPAICGNLFLVNNCRQHGSICGNWGNSLIRIINAIKESIFIGKRPLARPRGSSV